MQVKQSWIIWTMAVAFILFAGLSAAQAEEPESCIKSAKGPIRISEAPGSSGKGAQYPTPPTVTTARVGRPAPDFEASAFVNGKFKDIRLSDYKGKWVVLCFYPGDFTFV